MNVRSFHERSEACRASVINLVKPLDVPFQSAIRFSGCAQKARKNAFLWKSTFSPPVYRSRIHLEKVLKGVPPWTISLLKVAGARSAFSHRILPQIHRGFERNLSAKRAYLCCFFTSKGGANQRSAGFNLSISYCIRHYTCLFPWLLP